MPAGLTPYMEDEPDALAITRANEVAFEAQRDALKPVTGEHLLMVDERCVARGFNRDAVVSKAFEFGKPCYIHSEGASNRFFVERLY